MTGYRSSSLVDNMAVILEEVKDIHDPVAVLRYFQKSVMTGRQLDQTSLTEPLEGETQPIYVSRNNIFETGMEELLEASNLLVPLEVTFYGEEAADLGGPRKEFFALMLQELIKEECRLFEITEDGTYTLKDDSGGLDRKYFFGAGLVCGLSLMQNGPLPCFLTEEELETLLSQNLTPVQAQFRDGLNRLGFVDLMRRKPCIKYLFRPSARSALTQRKLIHTLKPVFSDIGSNRRLKEDGTYTKFLAYLKEVSGGRRGTEKSKVTLEKILKFVTASAEIPVLRYNMPPKIEFFDDESMLPRSSTCINALYLPLGHLQDDDNFFPFLIMLFSMNTLEKCDLIFSTSVKICSEIGNEKKVIYLSDITRIVYQVMLFYH